MFGARRYEGMFHLFIFLALVLEIHSSTEYLSAECHVIWILALYVGAGLEGIRGQQFLVALVVGLHFGHEYYLKGAVSNTRSILWFISVVAWIHSMVFVAKVGSFDFLRLWHPSDASPFAVGVRETRLTEKKLEATIYYPVDKESVAGKPFTVLWFTDPDRTIRSFKRVFSDMLKFTVPEFFCRIFTNV